eukprot:200775-Chlamydomonas_euryale.AAC.6
MRLGLNDAVRGRQVSCTVQSQMVTVTGSGRNLGTPVYVCIGHVSRGAPNVGAVCLLRVCVSKSDPYRATP